MKTINYLYLIDKICLSISSALEYTCISAERVDILWNGVSVELLVIIIGLQTLYCFRLRPILIMHIYRLATKVEEDRKEVETKSPLVSSCDHPVYVFRLIHRFTTTWKIHILPLIDDNSIVLEGIPFTCSRSIYYHMIIHDDDDDYR